MNFPGLSRVTTVQRTTILLILASWLLYLSVLAPSLATWDGGGMLNMSVSLIRHHDVTVEPIYGQAGRGGKLYGMWYPLLSVAAVPFVAAGIEAAHVTHLPESYVVAVCAIFLSTIIAALCVGATYYLARVSLCAGEHRSIAAALFFGFGTLALFYSRTFYADPLLTLIVTLIFIAMFDEEPKPWLLFALGCLVVPAKPVGVFASGLAFLYLAWHRKRNAAIATMLGTGIGCFFFAFYDWIRYENVFKSGQPNFWSLYEIPHGLPGLLFSPGVGIFIVCPVLLLIFTRRLSEKAWWILALSVGYLLLYSCWQRWFSSDWGPRFLMPVLPALIALSVFTKYRRLWLALACFSLVLQLPTAFAAPERHSAVLRAQGIPENVAVWSFPLSSTFGMWPSAIAQVEAAQSVDVREFSQFHQTASSFDEARNYRIVTIWWWMLPLVHIPRVAGALISFLEIALALLILLKLWRESPTTAATQSPAPVA